MGTKVRLKVVKADGSIEEYMHTKVIGAVSNTLAGCGRPDIYIAEQLADVVTYFLFRNDNLYSIGKNQRTVTSGEIFSIIKAVLTAADYEDAAIALIEHHFSRKLKRSRTEVVSIDVQQFTDAESLCKFRQSPPRCRWDKSKIVDDLVTNYNVFRQTARAIASMVEEKIFSMGLNLVPTGLIKQLVLNDVAVMMHAQQQLQTV